MAQTKHLPLQFLFTVNNYAFVYSTSNEIFQDVKLVVFWKYETIFVYGRNKIDQFAFSVGKKLWVESVDSAKAERFTTRMKSNLEESQFGIMFDIVFSVVLRGIVNSK